MTAKRLQRKTITSQFKIFSVQTRDQTSSLSERKVQPRLFSKLLFKPTELAQNYRKVYDFSYQNLYLNWQDLGLPSTAGEGQPMADTQIAKSPILC